MSSVINYLKHNDINFAKSESKLLNLNGINWFLHRLFPHESPLEIIDKIRVKLFCNWCSSKDLCFLWNKMSQNGNFCWNKIQIVWEAPYEYLVVVNDVNDIDRNEIEENLSKTIFFQMEPWVNSLDSFKNYSSKKNNFKKFLDYTTSYNNHEWHLSKTYIELTSLPIVKYRSLSTILHNNYSDIGSVRKIDMVQFLIKKQYPIDVYGYDYDCSKNFISSLPDHNTDKAHFDYKYVLVTENIYQPNYHTHRLLDGILSECLVFYSGDPTIRELLPAECFIYLHLSNLEHDYNIIANAIKNDEYTKRLPYILTAKKKILHELQFFPRLEKIICT